jgi:hypothetical protein
MMNPTDDRWNRKIGCPPTVRPYNLRVATAGTSFSLERVGKPIPINSFMLKKVLDMAMNTGIFYTKLLKDIYK